MKQEELNIERALQIVQQALDTVTTNGPERRLIDKAYLVLLSEVHKEMGSRKTENMAMSH